MFSLVSRLWSGLIRISPWLPTGNAHFVMTASPLIRLRSQRAVDFVRLYHEVHLNEDDVEEKFIKGSGPGGQKVNKSSNCVQLIHKPTGIMIKCHESRSLARNREIARQLLKQKLDFLYNGKESAVGQEIAKKKKRKANYAWKRRKRMEAVALGLQNMNDQTSDSVDDKEL